MLSVTQFDQLNNTVKFGGYFPGWNSKWLERNI